MAAEAGQYDPEAEMIEASADPFVASMALEGGSERRYLERLRKAHAHLNGLILDTEEQAVPESGSNRS